MDSNNPCNPLEDWRRLNNQMHKEILKPVLYKAPNGVPRTRPAGREMLAALHRIDMYLGEGNPHAAQIILQDVLREMEGDNYGR